MKTFFYLCFLSLLCGTARGEATAHSVRLGAHEEIYRFVIDISGKIDYNVFLLEEPHRVVVDLEETSPGFSQGDLPSPFGDVKDLRFGKREKQTRFTLEFDEKPVLKKVFLLNPAGDFPWRVVVDIAVGEAARGVAAVSPSSPSSPPPPSPLPKTKPVIVLDPGHGGKDPGAIGVSGIPEKSITFATAVLIKKKLDAMKKYTVHLTRTDDVALSLRARVEKARTVKGTVFVSIHADSNSNKDTKGLSVYTLSDKASDAEAAALAEKENKADIIAGIDLSNEVPEVAGILIDLARRETMNYSAQLASLIVRDLKDEITLLRNTHRFAGFAVLKAPDIPSVLVELGYLSNRREEKLLRQPAYREKLASSIAKALAKYIDEHQRALQ